MLNWTIKLLDNCCCFCVWVNYLEKKNNGIKSSIEYGGELDSVFSLWYDICAMSSNREMTQREGGVPLMLLIFLNRETGVLFDVVRFLRIAGDHRSLLLHWSRDGSAMNWRRGLRDGRWRRRRRVLLLHGGWRPAAITLRTTPAPCCGFETFHRFVETWTTLYRALLLLLLLWTLCMMMVLLLLLLLLNLLLEERSACVEWWGRVSLAKGSVIITGWFVAEKI